ncbi:MAG: hypothetical protein AAFP99_01075, partial [Pseudomonadota bacterium]
MLFSRKKKKRVEPRFETRKAGSLDGLTVSADDRVLPQSGRAKASAKPKPKPSAKRGKPTTSAKKAAPKTRAKTAERRKPATRKRTKATRAGRGLVGGLVYWSF